MRVNHAIDADGGVYTYQQQPEEQQEPFEASESPHNTVAHHWLCHLHISKAPFRLFLVD